MKELLKGRGSTFKTNMVNSPCEVSNSVPKINHNGRDHVEVLENFRFSERARLMGCLDSLWRSRGLSTEAKLRF